MANDSANGKDPKTKVQGEPALKKGEERRMSQRYALTLSAEIEDLKDQTRLPARTSDVSAHGCYLVTVNPLPTGSRVRVHLLKDNETFESAGVVVYANENQGMGVAFKDIPPEGQKAIRRWMSEGSRHETERESLDSVTAGNPSGKLK